MKKYFPLLLPVFLLVFFSCKQTLNEKQERESLLYAPDEFAEESEYAKWNFMRLRNPQTDNLPANFREDELQFATTLPKVAENRSLLWQNRGPYNLGGRTRALALDVTDENIILAGQVSGGMWRSTDGGSHFTSCTQPQQIHSVSCVAQDKRAGHTNVWYYGTGEQYGIVNAAGFSAQFSGDGIFKSTDGGVSWSQLPSTVSGSPNTLWQKRDFDFVWELATDASNAIDDEVYAATVNGIWRSINGGTSWTPVLGLDTSIAQISENTDVAITSTGVLYATISNETPSRGIWRSDDGITWTKITPVGFPSNFSRIEIGIAPSDETQVYFIAEASGTSFTGHSLWHYRYVSGDGTGLGGVWSNRTANIPHDHCTGFYTFDFRKYSSQTGYDMYIAVHPADPSLVFLGGTNIYRSWDGFTSPAYDWIGGYQCDSSHLANYTYPNHHSDQHKIVFYPSNNNKVISANDGGIMRCDNIVNPTITWQSLNNDYNTGQFYTCAVEPGNTNNPIIIGGLQDNGTYFTNTIDYRQDWSKPYIGDGGYCFITHNRTNYYMSWQTGKVFKLDVSDNGTVNNLTRIDPTGGSGALFIAPLIPDPFDDEIMYFACGKSIWRNDSLSAIPMTMNETATITQGWTNLPGTKTGILVSSPNISSLDISEANPNIMYFGTDQGQVFRMDSCKTTDTAQKINITGSNFPAGAYVSCVEVDRLNPNNVLVTFSNYNVVSIFYSNNAGQTWTDVSGNLEEHPDGSGTGPSVTWGHIYNDGSAIKYFIGTSIGLFSTDQLNSANTVWAQEGAGTIGNVVINMITSRTFDNNIVVATHGNGMYSNKIFDPNGIRKIESEIKFEVFPNPVSNEITVSSLQFCSANKTELKVYDVTGKEIYSAIPTAGNFIMQTANWQKGIYIVRCGSNAKKILKL